MNSDLYPSHDILIINIDPHCLHIPKISQLKLWLFKELIAMRRRLIARYAQKQMKINKATVNKQTRFVERREKHRPNVKSLQKSIKYYWSPCCYWFMQRKNNNNDDLNGWRRDVCRQSGIYISLLCFNRFMKRSHHT